MIFGYWEKLQLSIFIFFKSQLNDLRAKNKRQLNYPFECGIRNMFTHRVVQVINQIDVKQTQTKWVHRKGAKHVWWSFFCGNLFEKLHYKSLTVSYLFFSMFFFDPPENIIKPKVSENIGKERVKYAFIECAQQDNPTINIKIYWNLMIF